MSGRSTIPQVFTAIALLLVAAHRVDVACGQGAASSAADYAAQRNAMVAKEIEAAGVNNPRVLDAMRKTPRHEFMPAAYRPYAYIDAALPIGDRQTISPPFVVAYMTEQLNPQPTDRVLEIGTGSGYLTACLGRLAREVVSLERHADIAEAARVRLAMQGVSNATVLTADALAWDQGRSFDVVCVTGAVGEIPPAFLRWLNPGGRMFVVHGRSPAMEAVLVRVDGGGNAVNAPRIQSLFETDLPYLVGTAPVPTFEF